MLGRALVRRPLSTSTRLRAAAALAPRPSAPSPQTDASSVTDSLAAAARQGDFRRCQSLFSQLDDLGSRPTVSTYKSLLAAYAIHGLYPQASKSVKEMRKRIGEEPDDEMVRMLLIAAARAKPPVEAAPVLAELERRDPTGKWEDEPVVRRNRLLALGPRGGAVEEAVRLMQQAENRGKAFKRDDLALVFEMAVKDGEAGLASEVFRKMGGYDGLRQGDERRVVQLLALSSQELNVEDLQALWNVVRPHPRLASSLTSETLLTVLQACARHGSASLALEVLPHLLRAVEGSGVREFHLAPVVGALAKNRQIKEAVEMVAKMEEDGMTVSPSTVGGLVEAFNTPPAPAAAAGENEDARGEKQRVRGWNPSVEARAQAVDESYSLLLGLVSQGQKVPRAVLNGLVLACVRVPDLVRALETFREFGPSFDVRPDAWTFESLLEGCVRERNFKLADGLLDEMKAQGIAMTSACYDHRIRLHLYNSRLTSRGDEMERAFAMLEGIKSGGLTPLIDTYASLAWTLKRQGDPRLEGVLKEAREAGYGDLRGRIGLNRPQR